MENKTKSKYLGDILDNSGKVRANVEERRTKGFAMTFQQYQKRYHWGNIGWELD